MKNRVYPSSCRQNSGALPELAALSAGFDGFAPGESRRHRLYEMLHDAAERARGRQPQTFYSMTQVSRFFGVSTATVHTVYRTLEKEGLLVRVRGSRTFVPSRRMQPRIPVRGVLAVPIWRPGFVRLKDWRQFFIDLEEEVRRRGFVADLIFFRQGEEIQPEFVARVLAHQPDALLWFTPVVSEGLTNDAIADAGVRIGVVNHLLFKPSFSGRQYQLTWAEAVRQAAVAWKARGGRRVLLIYDSNPDCAVTRETRQGLISGGVKVDMLDLTSVRRQISKYLRGPTDTALLVDYEACFNLLPTDSCRLVEEMLAHGRHVILQRPRPLLAASGLVDIITPDWSKLARRIAMDLHTGVFARTDTPVQMTARYLPGLSPAAWTQGLDE